MNDKLIDFERAEVITPMIYPPQPRLVVSGVLPYPMDVSLAPLMYVSRPQWWGIQVVGSREPGPSVTPAITSIPYTVELDLQGISGTQGIEVIGETKTERIPVPAN